MSAKHAPAPVTSPGTGVPDVGFWGTVIDALAAGVLVTDTAGIVLIANQSAARALGAPAEECVGRDAQRILVLSLADASTRDGEPERRREARFTNLRGETIHIGVTVRSFLVRGAPAGYVLLFRELVRDSFPDEATMRHMERLASMGQMVAGFAHEVRNPLAALRALADDLAHELPHDDPRNEHVSRMSRNVRRIEEILRTSLQFARPSAPSVMPHGPAGIVQAALEIIRPRVRELGANDGKVRVEVAAGLPDVLVDDGQLVQTLVVLLNNALDATYDPGKVVVRVRERPSPRGSRVVLEVEDEGHGIAEDRLPQVFNAFYTTKDTGTGLGLSIAQKLVRENGGEISVRSQVGRGTTFTIELRAAVS